MADLAALKAAVDAAQAAKDELKAERIANRKTMLRQDFRGYNLSTGEKQRELHAAFDVAQKAFNDELKVIRADAVDKAINVAVGTVNETNTAGGAN